MAVEGSTDRWVFEAYVEHALAPALRAGLVVIIDNLSAHKPARVRELRAIADFAEAYADQTERDHAALKAGRVAGHAGA